MSLCERGERIGTVLSHFSVPLMCVACLLWSTTISNVTLYYNNSTLCQLTLAICTHTHSVYSPLLVQIESIILLTSRGGLVILSGLLFLSHYDLLLSE